MQSEPTTRFFIPVDIIQRLLTYPDRRRRRLADEAEKQKRVVTRSEPAPAREEVNYGRPGQIG